VSGTFPEIIPGSLQPKEILTKHKLNVQCNIIILLKEEKEEEEEK